MNIPKKNRKLIFSTLYPTRRVLHNVFKAADSGIRWSEMRTIDYIFMYPGTGTRASDGVQQEAAPKKSCGNDLSCSPKL